MMKVLKRHLLDYELALKYVTKILDEANTLSIEMLKLVNFSKGQFFTLLPNDANIENLYKFNEGGILPQNPEVEYSISDEETATYSIIPTIDSEISNFILHKIKEEEILCLFDDVLRFTSDKKLPDLFYKAGIVYENEIYYCVRKKDATFNLIKKCLKKSNSSFWHSLCVLSEIDIPKTDLKLNVVRDICLNAKLFFVIAYDREGFVFWEKNA